MDRYTFIKSFGFEYQGTSGFSKHFVDKNTMIQSRRDIPIKELDSILQSGSIFVTYSIDTGSILVQYHMNRLTATIVG